jgi:hypothetical protein
MCRRWLATFLTLATAAIAEPIEPADVAVMRTSSGANLPNLNLTEVQTSAE